MPTSHVSIETDEVCAGFGEYSAVECASLAFQAPAALGGKAVHTQGSLCFCLSGERGRASPAYVPTGVWGALDCGLPRLLICSSLLRLSLLQQLLVPSSNRESERISGLYCQGHLHLQALETDFFFVWS